MNFIIAFLMLMTTLGAAAVGYMDAKVDKLLMETSRLTDRVLVIEEEPRVVNVFIEAPKEEPKVEKPKTKLSIEPTGERVAYKKIDVFCMAKNIFHEARGEPTKGKYAVAQVTLNRMKNPKYPTTVCDVVMDPYQFSWANDRSVRWKHPRGAEWEEAKEISLKVLEQGYRVRGLESANYYHADYVDPNWKKPEAKLAKVGAHIFYSKAR